VVKQVDKLSGFLEIADVSFPLVQKEAGTACEQASRANRALHIEIIRKARLSHKREIWKKLKAGAKLRRERRARVINVLDVFRVYQQKCAFLEWRRRTVLLRERGRKDSLVGAQLQLDHFRNQLRMFDKALEKLHSEKASKQDLEEVRGETSQNRAESVFNDMRDLLDVTTRVMRNKISQITE